jgi:hypothetical protein
MSDSKDISLRQRPLFSITLRNAEGQEDRIFRMSKRYRIWKRNPDNILQNPENLVLLAPGMRNEPEKMAELCDSQRVNPGPNGNRAS